MLTYKTAYRITHINDFEHNDRETGGPGVVTAIGLQTTIIPQDDTVNNVAYNEHAIENKPNLKPVGIVGEEYLTIGSTSKYTTNMSDCIRKFKEDYAFISINIQNSEEGTCQVKVISNSRYVGKIAVLELVDSVSGEVVFTKEIKIRGFI